MRQRPLSLGILSLASESTPVFIVFFKILGQPNAPIAPYLQKQMMILGNWNHRLNVGKKDCSFPRAIALSSVTGICLIGLAQAGLFQAIELKAFDHFTQLTTRQTSDQKSDQTPGQKPGQSSDQKPDNQPPASETHQRAPSNAASDNIVIVAITEADIQAQKTWPFSDQIFAQLLGQLQQHSPQVIGLDIYRDIPHKPGTKALAKQLEQENVVTITKLDDLGRGEVPSPLKVPESRVGFNDIVIDPDGIVRRNFIFAAIGEQQLYSFALRLVEQFLAPQDIEVIAEEDAIRIGNTRIPSIEPTTGGYQQIDAAGYQTILRYAPPGNEARQLSFSQVLTNDYDPSWIEGKIVIIGTTAPSNKDAFYTPFSAATRDEVTTSGVNIHAQLTHQILSAVVNKRPLFSVWPQGGEMAWVLIWGLGGGVVVWRFSRPHELGIAATAGLLGLTATTGLLFAQAVWVPFFLPAVAFSLSGAAVTVYKEFRKTFYDSITGLPNRTLFTQALQDCLKRQPHRATAVILLDIDRFKVFNENFGLRTGDRLLQMMAKRLQRFFPPKTTIARAAGNEFVVLLNPIKQNPITQKEDTLALAQDLSQYMAIPIDIDGQQLFPTVSTGIAFHRANNKANNQNRPSFKTKWSKKHPLNPKTLHTAPLNAEDLLRDAQTAMSRAKLKGRGRCEVFEADMRTQLSNRLWLEADLRKALDNQEFLLYYQPLLCLKTMTVAGFEALIRWQHPERGMISPGEFIPIAEDTGLIVPIGQWVLEVACQQAQKWHQQFPERAPFISVNLSGRQFAQQDLVEQIDRILTETQLERSALKLELTESVVMDDVETSIEILLQLKALNLKLGIDDFGTGYSSLSYLHRFPIDILKVDRSFVMEMESPDGTAELVRIIIALGHSLGMNVVAEGIETESQSEHLQALQCEYGQGYLFAKPLPAQDAYNLLASNKSWHKKQ